MIFDHVRKEFDKKSKNKKNKLFGKYLRRSLHYDFCINSNKCPHVLFLSLERKQV